MAIDNIVHGATYHQLYRVTDERAWLLYSSLQRYIAMQSRERYSVTALQRYTRMGWLNPNPRTLPAVTESAPARIWRLKISRAIRRYSVTALQRYPRMGHP